MIISHNPNNKYNIQEHVIKYWTSIHASMVKKKKNPNLVMQSHINELKLKNGDYVCAWWETLILNMWFYYFELKPQQRINMKVKNNLDPTC